MNLRILIVGIFSLLCLSSAWADEFFFQPDKVASINLSTSKEGANVVVKMFDRVTGTETIGFKSKLTKKSEGIYVTPKGTTFTLKQLSKAVVNEENNTINSGDWQLTISGAGAELESLKIYAPEDGGGSDTEIVFLGNKMK